MINYQSSTLPLVSILLLQLLFLLWGVNCDSFGQSHVAAQLGAGNFSRVLGGKTDDQACLIEFYASWCPACKHFAPTFEKLASFLKDKRFEGRQLYIARVDCASEAELCGQFELRGYPSLLLGKAQDFAAKQPKKLRSFDGQRELPNLATWVGEYFNTVLAYTEQPAASTSGSGTTAGADGAAKGTAAVKRRPRPEGAEWSVADVEGATLQLWQIIASSPLLHRGPEKRKALREVLTGWAAAHPSGSCKARSARILSSFDELWPDQEEQAPAALLRLQPCDRRQREAAYRGEWVTCKGSLPDSRGYSCGLWQMLHTMALRLPERPGPEGPAQAMMSFLAAFNGHFFLCEVCQKHFGRILASPQAAAVTDKRALAMWLWRVHNEVNERLRNVETRYGHSTTGDPVFPKEQWPAREACPECRDGSGAWVEDEVWLYLQRAFGPGSAPDADKVVAVPVQLAELTDSGAGPRVGSPRAAAAGSSSWSSLSSLLPALGVLAVALVLYLVLRRSAAGRRRGPWVGLTPVGAPPLGK